MATLNELYAMRDSELRNKIVAACWNKAKEILTDSVSDPMTEEEGKRITYARDVLLAISPVEQIAIGAAVILQDAELTDVAIQGAVDAVVEKLISVEA